MDTKAETETTDRLPIGTRVKITGDIGLTPGNHLGTIMGDCLMHSGSYKVKIDGEEKGGVYFRGVYTVSPGNLEVVSTAEGDAALAAAIQRAERAERALSNFRSQVRDAVIEEADRHGWCDRTDGWLEELGLKPRWRYDGPRTLGTILRLEEGEYAVLSCLDDQPWRRLGHVSEDLDVAWLDFDDLATWPDLEVVYAGEGPQNPFVHL